MQAAGRRRGARPLVPFALALVALLLTGCSGGGGTATVDADVVLPEQVAERIDAGALVLDVRTPAEFATGHLADAVNIDVSSASFEDKVRTFDRSAGYVVYCRTGSRAGDAIRRMDELGFTDLVNGGGYEDLVAAGLRAN
jgi:phage shock protein E